MTDRRAALLTFDLGTTRLKVALFDLRGRLIAQRASRHVEHRADGHQWQEADAWWRDAVRLARALLRNRKRSVAAISLSGRGNAAVLVDRAGRVLENPWSDDRHAAELAALVAWRRGGYDLSNYGAALLAKKQWFVAHASKQKAKRLRHALYAKDFLLHRLTGLAVTDPTSGPDALAWDARALAHTDTAPEIVPQPALPWTIAGGLSQSAARAFGVAGLPSGTPVVVGAHDGICANVGAGAGFPGAYAITLGTHAVVRAIQAERPTGAYRFYGLPPDRHVIGGNGLMGGRAADWFLDIVHGRDDRARAEHFAQMDLRAAAVADGADDVRFFPFLSGSVAPERRPGARAGFSGLAARHDAAVLYRAVLEGTAFAVKDIFEQIRGWCGEPAVVRLTGSGATSELWCDLLAQILGRELEASDAAVEGRGAAIFAAVALGEYASYDAAARTMVPIERRYAPNAARVAAYAGHHGDWRRAVEAQRVLDR